MFYSPDYTPSNDEKPKCKACLQSVDVPLSSAAHFSVYCSDYCVPKGRKVVIELLPKR